MVMSVAPRARVVSERAFFTGMALAMALATFIGFAPTYYLAAFNDGPIPVLTLSIHIHGALTTAWIPDPHRRLTVRAGFSIGTPALRATWRAP